MVFGNMGNDSATGVAFTRNPATGEAVLYGEYLVNAQGEDVVAGIRTPQPIARMKDEMPAAYEEFAAIARRMESALQRFPGPGVHHRTRQAVYAADALGEAYRPRQRSK